MKRKKLSEKHAYRIPVVIEKDQRGYYAYCPSLQGCYTQALTYEEAVNRLRDAIRLHLEDRQANGEQVSQPSQISLTELEIAV